MDNMTVSVLAEIYAQLALLESMKAANLEREQKGLAQAYDEAAFMEIYDILINLADRLRG